MTSIRLPISFAMAVCATLSLFWLLGVLIAVEPGRGRDFLPTIRGIDFITHIPESEPIRIIRVKPVFEKPKPQPDLPVVPTDRHEVLPTNDSPDLSPPEVFGTGELGVPPGHRTDITRVGGSDRPATPQVRIEPDYPALAKARGIEGWITFRFTVATDGSVKDVVILDSQPPHVWDSATIRAVSSWKYQPRIVDGKPVEQVGLTATYRYELDRS